MTIALTMIAYIVVAAFYIRVIWRLVLWSRQSMEEMPGKGSAISSFVQSVFDILFLRRLLRANPLLWFGEWVFHASFIIVFTTHLRYVFLTPPALVVFLMPLAKVTAYTLPVSLIYIILFRFISLVAVKDFFTSRYNLFLTTSILLTAISGGLLKYVYRPDIINVKQYVMDGLAFSPAMLPKSALFALHFTLAMLVISVVPSHIFTAPFVSYDASRRERTLKSLVHDDE